MSRIPKTRCSGTMTEAAFFSFLRSNIRRISMKWKPIRDAKAEHRRPNEAGTRHKWEYQCGICNKWTHDARTKTDSGGNKVLNKRGKPIRESLIQVGHLIPCGSLKCMEDVAGFVERLFCEVEHLILHCTECHQEITNKEREERKKNK